MALAHMIILNKIMTYKKILNIQRIMIMKDLGIGYISDTLKKDKKLLLMYILDIVRLLNNNFGEELNTLLHIIN